ncbi:peptide ABC transporter substrate-binding protein [Candidatus Falkowbacteria bacterium]|nr:peptide ABC transporter substrate-binding protein [Candidatus Falkowbacteria bacterium]
MSSLKDEAGFADDPSSQKTESFIRQKELDKKLVYSLNTKKIPSLKQLKYLPKVLNPKQRLAVITLSILICISLISLVAAFYLRNFIPTPAFGGEYSEGLIGAPQYINPLLSQTNDVDSDISRLIFSGLLKYDNDLQLVPELTRQWQASEDQKVYTFTLKENILWHDGQPLTASDVVFTFQSLKDPDFKSPLLISFRGVNVEKLDDLTVRFTLPEAFPSFLEVLTVGILPEHIWSAIPPVNANLTEYNLKPVGSGPWKFKSLSKDKLGNIKSYTLAPNENYYGPKPYIQKLTFKFYPDFQTAIEALKNNSVEGVSFLPKELKSELTGQKNLNFYSFNLPQYTAIFFNQKENEALKDKNVRKALSVSIDKTKILSEALQLEGEIINGPILPVAVSQNSNDTAFNPGQASLILDEAGWERITPQDYQNFLINRQEAAAEKAEEAISEGSSEIKLSNGENQQAPAATATAEITTAETGQDFYRKKADVILEVTLTTVNQPENIKAAELIKDFWQAVGFKVNLEIIEGGRISREIIKPRDYQILLFGIIVGGNPDPYPFWHSSQIQDPGLNLAQFASRETDKLLEDGRKTLDQEIQVQSYQRFQEILSSEIPAIFLYNPTYTYVADKKIKGINIDRIIIPADRFNDLPDWYTKTKRKYQGNIY